MGLLNRNKRVLDVAITAQGRRAICEGNFVPAYASFSDEDVVYKNVTSGTYDPGDGVSFEANSSTHDSIFFVIDREGSQVKFRVQDLVSTNGKLFSAAGSELTGSVEFANAYEKFLKKPQTSLASLSVISTVDFEFDDLDFSVTPSSNTFQMTDSLPVKSDKTTTIDDHESVFEDKDFSGMINFAYLPPINKKSDDGKVKLLGNYQPFFSVEKKDYRQLKQEFNPKYTKNILFDPATRENNIAFQVFETCNSRIRKLDVYKFCDNPETYLVGKAEVDSAGTLVFVRLFALVFK